MKLQFIQKVRSNFFSASSSQRARYLSALRWSFAVRFAMVFLPFRFFKHWYGVMNEKAVQQLSQEQMSEAIEIRNIVLSVCRNTPWESKCLVQALACKMMLQKKGIDSTLFLGVRTGMNDKEMEAHAWLKLGERIITGQEGHRTFKVVNVYY